MPAPAMACGAAVDAALGGARELHIQLAHGKRLDRTIRPAGNLHGQCRTVDALYVERAHPRKADGFERLEHDAGVDISPPEP